MRRAVLLAVILVFGASVLKAPGVVVFSTTVLTAAFVFRVYGWRDGALINALVISVPALLIAFSLPFFLRVACATLFGALLFWAVLDVQRRSRGVAVHLGRLEFFLYAGVYAVAASLFASVDTEALPPFVVVFFAPVTAFFSVFLLRSVAERSRATGPLAISPFLDAFLASLLFAEVFFAFSFLPFSPLTRAGALVALLWALGAILVAMRTDILTASRLIKIGAIEAVLFAVLFATVPWVSFS